MSRLAKKPLVIPQKVEVKIAASVIEVKGPKGQLRLELAQGILVECEDGNLWVKCEGKGHESRARQGLYYRLIGNMLTGVSQGFTKELEIVGVGYKAAMKGKALELSLGYSHPIYFEPPEGIKIEVPRPNLVVVSGIDRHEVGQIAANIRSLRPPEPYKGKGVRYAGEQVRKKVGKAGVKAGGS